jgi:hypothetical protein
MEVNTSAPILGRIRKYYNTTWIQALLLHNIRVVIMKPHSKINLKTKIRGIIKVLILVETQAERLTFQR